MQTRVLLQTLVVVVFACGSNAVTVGQTTVTVGAGADCDFGTIQEGIDAAEDRDVVLVAAGEYIVTTPITFRGKAITVRSETGRDETVIRMGVPDDSRRASVVVFENDETDASILEGFTLTEGRGCWGTDPLLAASGLSGGGILCVGSSPTVIACTITKNTADNGGGVNPTNGALLTLIGCTITDNSVPGSGGGISCWDNSSLTMIDCVVRGNSAPGTTIYVNGNGGGIFCGQRSELRMTNCNISENSAGITGGGITCDLNSALTMTNCSITNNTSERWTAGIGCRYSSVTLTNCIISGNTSALWCGGVHAGPYSSLSIRNCTVLGNSAGQNGGGAYCWDGASMTVTNSIFRDNTAPSGREFFLKSPSRLNISYSNVAGGQTGVYVGGASTLEWGAGNIDTDPYFAEPGYWADVNDPNLVVEPDDANAMWIDSDFHLKSEAGRWDPHRESWVVDEVTSPCIDRGDPSSPVGSEPDPNGGLVNMGAYGGMSEASMSIGYLPPLPVIPIAHWKLDEAEGEKAFDDVGRNHALVVGDPTWWPDGGVVDGAIELDGTDDFLVADKVLNPIEGPFSIFAWVKGGGPGQVVISQTNGSAWLLADPAEGCLMTGLSMPSGGRFAPKPLVSTSPITDSDWHRIGLVWDGSHRVLYIDDLETARDSQSSLGGSDGGLNIGADISLDPGTFWSGLIDDIRIYNCAVNP